MDRTSGDDVDFSDDEELNKSESNDDVQEDEEEEGEDDFLSDDEMEKDTDLKEKEKSGAGNQFLIREGYTIEHRVAIMNREAKYLMSLGKYDAALPVTTEAIQLNQSPLSYLNRAHIYKNLKRFEEAIIDFTTVIENDTLNTAASLCQRGICYSKLLDYERAIDDLNRSHQLDPSFSCAFNRGSIFAESGDHESAVLDFNRITDGKLDGELRNRTVYYRAVSFVHLKRYDDAKFDLRSILLKEPNALAPRSLLAKAYKHTGHYQQSEECLNQCITKDCDQADLFIERSYIRCRLGSDHNIKEAYKDLNKAMVILVREYDNDKAREKKERKKRLSDLSAATPLSKQGSGLPSLLSSPSAQADSRKKSLARVPTRSGSVKMLLKQKSINSIASSRSAHAVDYFGSTKIASVYAKLAQLLTLMPLGFFTQISNLDLALEHADTARKICPKNSGFVMIYLTCLLRLSKYEEASLLLDGLLKEDPDHKKALYYKAFCHRAVNDPLNAVDCLTKILSLNSAGANGDNASAVSDDELLDGESFLLRVLEMRGLLLHEQNAYKFALADFGRAICIDSSRPGNFYFRGNCHSKLGNFEMAIHDFCLAEECNFPNLPFLLMCKGVVLRLIGDNERAIVEFDRAITAIDSMEGERDRGVKLLLCRTYIYKSLSFITIKKFGKALENLLKIRGAVDGTLNTVRAPKQHKFAHSPKTRSIKPGDCFEEIIEPSLRWLVSYHVALTYYMMKDYGNSMKHLKSCLGPLRSHAPDNIALGSCIFFYSVAASVVYKSSNPEEELYMNNCVDLLGECLHTDWCRAKDYNAMLCHFSLGKCHQRLDHHSEAILHFTEAMSKVDEQDPVISYIYFRRAWSHKAQSHYPLAANDFECAKILKLDDPNFSINYRKINAIAYIEIDNEPDTVEEFMPIFPSYGVGAS